MQLTGRTILITGGSSGIGLEMAKQLIALGNTVIITGRDRARLDAAKAKIPGVHLIQSDASSPAAITELVGAVTREFPALDILVNNAGIMRRTNFNVPDDDLAGFTKEIEINLMGPIRLVKALLPHLKSKPSAAIVNVSSGLAFVPLPISPIYCATKAGLHSFTQSLRFQLKKTKITVFEVAPPATETPLLSAEFARDLKDVKLMPVADMVKASLAGMRKGTLEICPGQSGGLRFMNRVAPGFILGQLGKSIDGMLAESSPGRTGGAA